MCGRYTLRLTSREIAAACGLAEGPDLAPRFNIAPTQEVLAVRRGASRREAVRARWGLPIRGGPAEGRISVNVRSETAAEKPSFKSAFAARRCVMPADGFYEWVRGSDGKLLQAWHFRRRDGGPLLMAALWEPGDTDDAPLVAPLTTGPNSVIRPIHDRMPVLLAPEDMERWLDPAVRGEECRALLQPRENPPIEALRVGTYVNSARHEGPRCLEPDPQGELDLFGTA